MINESTSMPTSCAQRTRCPSTSLQSSSAPGQAINPTSAIASSLAKKSRGPRYCSAIRVAPYFRHRFILQQGHRTPFIDIVTQYHHKISPAAQLSRRFFHFLRFKYECFQSPARNLSDFTKNLQLAFSLPHGRDLYAALPPQSSPLPAG